MKQEKSFVKFHIFKFLFTPYKQNQHLSSKQILKECIDHINKVKIGDPNKGNGKAIIIDRYKNRTNQNPRNLFISSAAFSSSDRKYKCRIAKIREGKIPNLVDKETYAITEFDQLNDKLIAETTNFYIDVDGDKPVVCCEFNPEGPRALDIEYYFRQIAHNVLNISRSSKIQFDMKKSLKETLDSLANIFRFTIKVKPSRLNYLTEKTGEAFIANMNGLANSIDSGTIRIESFFREKGSTENKSAIKFCKKILSSAKDDHNFAENIEDFEIEFEKNDGTDDTFNLLKNKVEINIECPLKQNGNINTKEMYSLTLPKFNNYLSNRNENND